MTDERNSGERAKDERDEDFRLEFHGSVVVISPAESIESMRWDLIEQAAEVVMDPLTAMPVPLVVFDLTRASYFGSVFLALLVRCHTFVKARGGEMVLCGAGDTARELLRVTNFDTLWAIYDTREQALDAVGA